MLAAVELDLALINVLGIRIYSQAFAYFTDHKVSQTVQAAQIKIFHLIKSIRLKKKIYLINEKDF